jgi:hypothetical protein
MKVGMKKVENGEILSLLLDIEFLNLKAAADLIKSSAQGKLLSAIRKYQNIRLNESSPGPKNLKRVRRNQRNLVTEA